MLDRVKKKLAGWKANLLSMVGRVVLIQASSSTIPNYVMPYASLPNKILNGIDRVNRNFLWGTTDHVKKMHWVNWGKVSKPKEVGGLDLQTTKGRNTTLLAKLNWRFHKEGNAPWAKVLKFKYCNRLRLNSRNEARLPCSLVWKGLKKGEEFLKKGLNGSQDMKAALTSGLILGQILVPSSLKSKARSRKPQITYRLKMCSRPLVGIGLLFLLSFPQK